MNKRTVPINSIGLRVAFALLLPVVAALFTPLSAGAQDLDVPPPYDRLNLTDEQIGQIHTLDLD